MSGCLQIMLAASPASITITSNWGTTGPGASPQTSGSRTLTVPGGSGTIRFDITSTPSGSFEYQLNVGAFTTITDLGTLAVANGDTLRFRLTGVSDAGTVVIYDNTTNVQVGTSTIITT